MSLEDTTLVSKAATAGWSLIGSSATAAVVNGETVTLNGRIWNLDGDPNRTVVFSSDGVTWSSNGKLPYRMSSAACAHNGALWVSGGAIEDATSDVYTSTDGVTWTHSVAPWPPRFGHSMISDGDQITLFGGRSLETPSYRDCWVSKDGISWASIGSGEAIVDGSAAVVGPDLCLIDPINRAVYWYDGGRWLRPETAPWSSRVRPGVAVVNDVLYLVGGSRGPTGMNDMWSATRPGTWKPDENAPWTGALNGPGCGELNGAMLVFGGRDASGAARPEIYRYTPA